MIVLLGTWACIGEIPMKITCYCLKNKRKINAVVLKNIGMPQGLMREKYFYFLPVDIFAL